MTFLLFPDNTVLVNFARVSRMALLESLLAGHGRWTTDHLGEAETFAVITSRGLNAIFVTDDVRAARLARSLELGTLSTAEVFRLAVHTKYLTVDEAWKALENLRQDGRVLPHCPLTLGQFRTWCS